MKQFLSNQSISRVALAALAMTTLSVGAFAQNTYAGSIVGVNNEGYIAAMDQAWTDGSTATAQTTRDFTGMDSAGNTQVMPFSGTTVTSAQYGRLHSYTSGTVSNTYYNPANPIAADYWGTTFYPDGSPKVFSLLGFAGFNDTLQYGGALEAGYQARFIFHVDGTNSGTGAAADLAVNVQDQPSQGFFDFSNGYLSTTWATTGFDINGTTPQNLNVQFSDQVVFNLDQIPEGGSYTGTSDFSSTLTMTGIQIVDANGKQVSGVTVTSGSGTIYAVNPSVPAPGGVPMVIGMAGAMIRRMRKRTN